MRNTRSFLFATFEGGGSVTPALTVVRELVRRGHRVRMMSDPCNRPESEAAGAAFVPWTRAPGKAERMRECDTFSDWDAADAAEGFMMLMDSVLTGPSLAFAEDVIAELRREPADLVVSSEMLFGVHAACEAIGQELALLAVNIGLFPIPGIPPMGPGLAPARTAEEHAVHAAITRGTMELLNGRALPALNRARAALGLPALTSLVDQHRAARVLMLATARAFDFAPAALPPHIAYVGPQLGEPAWAAPWQSPFAAGDARPLVLVSFSTTFQNHLGPLQRVIDALATLPVKAVVTLGGSIYADEVEPAPNVALLGSAPHAPIMAEAAVVVCHGGHGTVMKALAAGRPMLVIPHGRDQNDNAARVAERGAGIVLPPLASAAEIAHAVRRILAEPGFAASAARLGADVRREAAETPVFAMLEGLAACGTLRRAA